MNRNNRVYNKEIYPLRVLDYAAHAYKDIVRIKIIELEDVSVCEFRHSKAPIELVINEFNNFLIEVSNQRDADGLL